MDLLHSSPTLRYETSLHVEAHACKNPLVESPLLLMRFRTGVVTGKSNARIEQTSYNSSWPVCRPRSKQFATPEEKFTHGTQNSLTGSMKT